MAADRAATSQRFVRPSSGQKVALVEREFLGGVCLNIGCIPTKSLLRNAELANILTGESKDFGFSFENL